MDARLYFKLKNPPWGDLCKRYNKPMPKRDALQKLAKQFPYRWYNEDYTTLTSPEGGPFTDAMALVVQSYLGLDAYHTDEILMTSEVPPHILKMMDRSDIFLKGMGGRD